jgi:hypothetical protein
VLYHHNRFRWITKFPELRYVGITDHITVGEDGPTTVVHQVWRQEARVDEHIATILMGFGITPDCLRIKRKELNWQTRS